MFLQRMEKRRRAMELSLALGLLLTVAAAGQLAAWDRDCSRLRQDTLRLHVVAASDSLADQQVKLKVRDELVQSCGRLFEGCTGKEEARQRALLCLPRLSLTAREAAARAGFRGPVTVRLTGMYFPTRRYEGFTLPAGRYEALRVQLGGGRGHNWWCVLYPALCLPGSGASYPLPEEQAQVSGGWEIRFAAVEWWQRLTGRDRAAETPSAIL